MADAKVHEGCWVMKKLEPLFRWIKRWLAAGADHKKDISALSAMLMCEKDKD